jgi:hypothetical protein
VNGQGIAVYRPQKPLDFGIGYYPPPNTPQQQNRRKRQRGAVTMTDTAYGVLETIAQTTASELILFFVIMAVIAVPLYIVVLKGRKADKEHERARETQSMEWQKQILDVIKENSSVISGLKVTLDNSGEITKSTLERIHKRIDDGNVISKEISTDIAQMKVKFANSLDNQKELASKLNKVLIIVDSIPNNSSFSSIYSGEIKGVGFNDTVE